MWFKKVHINMLPRKRKVKEVFSSRQACKAYKSRRNFLERMGKEYKKLPRALCFVYITTFCCQR